MSVDKRPVMIMAGGTGGHIYPALAVARYLQRMGVPVVWLGTHQGLEARIVPQAGLPIEWLSVHGLRGKSAATLALAPFKILMALVQAVGVMLKHQPRAVLGMGGFASGPGGLAAKLLGKPLVLHEQNAVAGLTNRLLAPLSQVLMTGFPDVFPSSRAVYVGNPVRAEIVAVPTPEQRFAGRNGPVRVLVLGGSQGAKALNEIAPAAFALLGRDVELDIWHQAGAKLIDGARATYASAGISVRLDPYIEDMAGAYGWADLVLCRSGALTVAEIAAAGVASVLVPFPHAVDDHQTANGRYLEHAGAARLVSQEGLNAQGLADILRPLVGDRGRLRAMAMAARELVMPEADRLVAEACVAMGVSRRGHKTGGTLHVQDRGA